VFTDIIAFVADVIGKSEVPLCTYRHLEDIMVKLEELKILSCFYSRFLVNIC